MSEAITEPVLAMYDVRGIQEYVFRTNKVKEIIGASSIVANIFDRGLNAAIEKLGIKNSLLKWKNAVFQFASDPSVELEVIYIGGGNTLILYRSRKLCRSVNRLISKYIFEKTYSLNLAIAVVPYTGAYDSDFKNLSVKMSEVKATMPLARLAGNLPLTRQDSNTGYPLSEYYPSRSLVSVSKESFFKLNEKVEDVTSETEFDSMTSDKGNDSQLAIVHIDGNNIGSRIKFLMNNITSYKEAVEKERVISRNINHAFSEALDDVEKKLSIYVASEACNFPHKIKKENKDGSREYQKYMRRIINSGDDITFVCNAKVAISLCEVFLNSISTKALINNDIENYGFSACAGIAIINSHFPFYEGYKVADECCSIAKKRAKLVASEVAKENANEKENEIPFARNGIDFQICKHIATSSDLEENRKKHYSLPDGTNLLTRPYLLDSPGENSKYELCKFKEAFNHFKSSSFPMNIAKDLRNAYSKGEYEATMVRNRMISRGTKLPNNDSDLYEEKTAKYFDALEMLDLYIDILKKEE